MSDPTRKAWSRVVQRRGMLTWNSGTPAATSQTMLAESH
jgi:hypothetical protein